MLNIYDVIGKRYVINGDSIKIFPAIPPFIKGGRGDFGVKGEQPLTLRGACNKVIQLHIKESGTCLRFILPYFAFCDYSLTITLGERLSQRPIIALIDCLNQAGASINSIDNKILITKAILKDQSFYIDSSESSQFVSSLLMYASSLKSQSKLIIEKDIASESYVKMTVDVLKLFSTKANFLNNEMIVEQNCQLSTVNCQLPPDYSTACYYFLYSYLLKKTVFIKNDTSIYQPDYYFIDVLKSMNINFIEDGDYISVDPNNIPTSDFRLPNCIDMSNMPDQIITLSFLLLFSGIRGKVSGCKTLFKKESNRVEGIIENIKLLGGDADYTDDILSISPLDNEPKQCLLKTYNDHRFAMTFLVIKEKYPYLEIDNIECVSKSYPLFLAHG